MFGIRNEQQRCAQLLHRFEDWRKTTPFDLPWRVFLDTPSDHCENLHTSAKHTLRQASSIEEFLDDLGSRAHDVLVEATQLSTELFSFSAGLAQQVPEMPVNLFHQAVSLSLQHDPPQEGAPSIALKSDVQEYQDGVICLDSRSAIRTVENLDCRFVFLSHAQTHQFQQISVKSAKDNLRNWYIPHGFWISPHTFGRGVRPTAQHSVRQLHITPWAARLVGCQPSLWYLSGER